MNSGITAKDISAQLARQAETVARMLVPGGKKKGAEWKAGSVQGGDGDSFGVHLSGDRAGYWKDFASGEKGGDLIDLWAAAKGLTLGDAIREAKDFLGIREPRFEGHKTKKFREPDVKRKSTVGAVAEYLGGRGLTVETIKAFKVAASEDDKAIIFPFLRGDKLINAKTLMLERPNGEKKMFMEKDCEPCLFGWHTIPKDARTVVITEGEIDAMSWYQLGRPALSVPNGSKGMQWIEYEFHNLERFDEIFIAFDADDVGREGALELAGRLGRERCRLVELPMKDANELLQKGFVADEVDPFFKKAKTCDPEELKNASLYVDQVIAEFYPPEGQRTGFEVPWETLKSGLRFRPTEVVIVNGINGHGKSQAVGHLVLEAIDKSERACIASMEMKPRMWLKRLDIQATAMREPQIPYIRMVHEWFEDKLWVFDLVGTARSERMLEVFKYARKRYGVTLFVIDSLLKCGLGEDDYNGQKLFVERLCDFANEHEVTVFLVTHSRKMDNEREQGDKMDVRGAGAITDLASTVLNVWRNKKKEESPDKFADEPDVIFSCQKQRNGDWEGRKFLWFHKDSFQYLETSKSRPRRYVQYLKPVEKPEEIAF